MFLQRIQQVHRDHVPSLPPKFHLLGSTDKCLVQGIVLPYGSAAEVTSFSDIHILCLQGHPEFTTDIVQKVVDVREASGVLDAPTAQEARRRAVLEHDGVNVVGKVIWKLFGLSFLPSV
jgi:GMP synthase-like glutamine amidotransferase